MATKKPKMKKFYRFDPVKAEKGVKHHIVDEVGNDYGVWTTSLFDHHNKFLKVEHERYEREHGDDDRAKGSLAGVYAFVQICVHDFSGVVDENDKEIPFSKEAAFDILSDDDGSWLFEQLMKASQDVLNYRHSPDAKKGEISGN